MINLKLTGCVEDIIAEAGVKTEEELWNLGFNLDDWDACFIADKPLHTSIKTRDLYPDEEGYKELSSEEYMALGCEQRWDYEIILTYYDDEYDEKSWLFHRMENYCVGFNYTYANGKHFYTVHHS